MADALKVAGGLVQSLQRLIGSGKHDLTELPEFVKLVIREDAWRERVDASMGGHFQFASFREFVETPLIEGLGADLDTLKRLCREDMEALDLIDQATTAKPGRPAKPEDSKTLSIVKDLGPDAYPVGNGAQYALRKLRKDRPDLHAEVIAGQKSPHAAMVEAGFRPKTFTVRADPHAIASLALKRLSNTELRELVRQIVRGANLNLKEQTE